MNPLLQVPGSATGKFRPGQSVRIKHGFRGMIGEVIEDRGPIGIRGRRLYVVRLQLDPWNVHTTELPEESLEALAGAAKSHPAANGHETQR